MGTVIWLLCYGGGTDEVEARKSDNVAVKQERTKRHDIVDATVEGMWKTWVRDHWGPHQ